jgi:hypothetical protein
LNPSPKDREGEEKTGMGGEEQGREGKRWELARLRQLRKNKLQLQSCWTSYHQRLMWYRFITS